MIINIECFGVKLFRLSKHLLEFDIKRVSWFLLTLLAWPGLCRAADKPTKPSFVLTLPDGTTAEGPLEVIGEKWSVRLGGDKGLRADGEQVLTLRRSGLPRPAPPRGEQVLLANGDRLPARVLAMKGERLRVAVNLGREQEWSIPLSAVAAVWVAPPDGEDHPEQLLRQLLAGKRRRDTLYLRNSDVLEGLLTGLEGGGRVRVSVGKKEVQVGYDGLAAVALSTELARRSNPKELYGRLVLTDGGRLTLASARTADGALVGKTPFGAEVAVPLERLAALDLFGGRAAYLSDLKPTRYETTPYLGVSWRYVLDGSVADGNDPAGAALRLAGNTFDKGIGMHSPSRLTFDLGGRYRRFEARVGLDETGGRRGSARVRVLVDGKPQEIDGGNELTASTGPRAVRVNVAGAKELTLVVDTARFGDVQGRVNWVDARLIK